MRPALFAGISGAAKLLARRVAQAQARANQAPQQAQALVLRDIVGTMARTEYGQSLGLDGSETLETFRQKVPVVDYEAIAPWVVRQQGSERPVLAPERVRFFETTSGSSGAKKHIAYTRGLMRSMTNMLLLWADDVLRHGPQLRTGTAYFSVSPHFAPPEATPSGTRLGADNDADYVSSVTGWLISSLAVTVPGLKQCHRPQDFHRALCERLLRAQQLELISVWSPTFLSVALDYAVAHADELARATSLDARRASALAAGQFIDVWPHLKLISCWADGASAGPAHELAERLPHAWLQPKGLLATEAPLTYPLIGREGGVPLLNEVLFEFQCDDGALKTIDELDEGDEAELIISQKAGLLRYRLGDRVRVVGRLSHAPLLSFVRRAGAVSDLVGEKLHEALVVDALRALGLRDGVLIPDALARQYVLAAPSPTDAEALERKLLAAFHYQRARALGQLQPVRAVARAQLAELMQSLLTERGQKLGDIKDRALLWRPDEAAAALKAIEPHESRA